MSSLLALAGCIGSGDEDEAGDGDDNETDDAGDADTNETGNETNETPDFDDPPEGSSWEVDDRTGNVEGANVVVVALSGAEETFTVVDGASELFISVNVSAPEGGMATEVLVEIAPPSCADGPPTDLVTGCADAESGETTDGTYSFSADSPDAGEWTVGLFCGEPGPCNVDYELVIAQLVPADAGGDAIEDNETILG